MDNEQQPRAGGGEPRLVVANPHYRLIGVEDATHRLVDRCCAPMDALPEARTIRALHAADLS